MRKIIDVPPPSNFANFSPSELFRFFFQLGRWTEESFSDEFQAFTRGKLVSTVTLSKWKNKDVVPARYSGPLLKMIENSVEPNLSTQWLRAFETVWAHQSSGRSAKTPDSDPSSFSDTICAQHKKWITGLYHSPQYENSVVLADLYVPLQLYNVMQESPLPHNIEDIFEAPVKSDWTFISGGPGSGKSMTALHIANRLSKKNLFPVYLRASRLSAIDIDITDPNQLITDSFSFKSFFKHFRTSSFKTACLVLDGIDEVGYASQDSLGHLNRILSELKTEQAACKAHGKTLRMILLGRDTHIQAATTQITSEDFRHFRLLALDGSYRSIDDSRNPIQGEDFREKWWANYLSATGHVSDPSLPDFLTTEYDDFSEFGTDPLLATLICKTALADSAKRTSAALPHERVNALTYTSNKNTIYRTIVEQIASSERLDLEPQRFLSALQEIAVHAWQNGNERSVSIKIVYENIVDKSVKAAFHSLNLSDNANDVPPDMLMTGFYYRLTESEKTPRERVVEFTHKTFSEYLVSTCLFDKFIDLISAFDDPPEFSKALSGWTRISHSGQHDPSLGDFCQKEAGLQYDSISKLDFDIALYIIKNHINASRFHDPKASSISHMQNSASLLFFIWSCLNLERQKRNGDRYPLSQATGCFNGNDLKSIQRPNGLDFSTGSRLEPKLREPSFLTPSLSGLKLKSIDMSQLCFNLGHMENLISENTSFAMTHWSHVKTSDTKFYKSVFQQAIFHQWRVFKTGFDKCLFQGARFQGANFSECHFTKTFFSQCHFFDVDFTTTQWAGVAFDRCVFSECVFDTLNRDEKLIGAEFTHCTFMDTDKYSMPMSHSRKLKTELDALL